MNDTTYVYDVTQADFEEKVLVASTRVPVLVDFWAPWCAPCRQISPVLDKLAAEYRGQLLVAKVNTDDEMQIAALFGIRSLPTVMLVRNGRPVDGFMGAQPESAIRQFLAQHLGAEPGPLPEDELDLVDEIELTPEERVEDARARVAAEPDKDELKLELAQALIEIGEVDEVVRILDRLPANLAEGDVPKKLRARIGFAHAIKDAPDLDSLRRAVAAQPGDLRARHQLGTRYLLQGLEAEALEQFFEIMKRDRAFDDDLGRKTLIAAFALIDDADLVSATRRKMSALLF